MMRKFIALFFLAIVLGPAILHAGIHGILKGKVLDEEGKGVIGASVMVEGTTRGTYVKSKDGAYQVANIVAGEYTIVYRSVGKPEIKKKIRISADEVTEIDVVMKDKSVEMKEIVIESSKMVEKTPSGKIDKLDTKALTSTAREGITSVIALSAGVRNDGSGFNIRGSRSSETQIRVDGFDVGNQFTGGLGAGGTKYYPMVSANATEEVQVLTGNFTAEYGEAQGGVVNSVVKTGRTDRYEGFLRYRTDLPSLYGSQASGVEFVREGNRLKPVSAGKGAKYQGSDENSYEFGVGGPIPMLGKSTFYLTGRYYNEAYRGASYEVYDPAGNNIGKLPQQSWVKNITGKFRFEPIKDLSLIVGGSYGISCFEINSLPWYYSTDPGIINGKSNGIPENVAKQNAINQIVSQLYAKINHNLNSNSFYEFSISNTSNNDENARRKSFGDPNFFTGFELLDPVDNLVLNNQQQLVPGEMKNGRVYGDKIVDYYQSITSIGYTKDGRMKLDLPQRNPLTGYYEGAPNSSGTNNPWGLKNFTMTSGASGGFQFRYGNYWQVEGSYTNSFQTGDFSHIFKGGIDFRFFEQHRHYNSMPWDGNPFFDVYTDKFGGNIYADDPNIYAKTSLPYKPSKYAAYVQDEIRYKGIIFNPGLRLDLFNPNSKYRTGTKFVSIRSDSGFGDASIKYQISPRINVAYPITDQSVFQISYGLYFKTPEMQYMFDKFPVDVLRTGDILGNPNVEAQRTNAYSVSFKQGITDDIAVEVSAYYKDIFNQLGVKYVEDIPTPYYQYTVAEFGNAKGIEVDLRKRPTMDDHVGLRVNYSYASAVGTASDPTSNFGQTIDQYTNMAMFPLVPFSQPWDIRHNVNASIDFTWANNQGPSIGGIQLLENLDIDFTAVYRSGLPYTKTDLNRKPLSEINSERGPSFWRIDSRIQKGFWLSDWFGAGAGNTYLSFFADIVNLTNNRGITGFYTATGDALDDGTSLNRKVGDFDSTPYYKDATVSNPSTYSSTQYDNYGNRLYNANADFDQNGIVTQAEKYQSYVNYVKTTMKFKGNFQTPITFSAGIALSF